MVAFKHRCADPGCKKCAAGEPLMSVGEIAQTIVDAFSLNMVKWIGDGAPHFKLYFDGLANGIADIIKAEEGHEQIPMELMLHEMSKLVKRVPYTGQLLLGTSFSWCMSDLMAGKVPVEKVLAIFTNTSYKADDRGRPVNVEDMVLDHAKIHPGWDVDKLRSIVNALDGKLFQLLTMCGKCCGDSGSPWLVADEGERIAIVPSNTVGGLQFIGSRVEI